MTPKLRLVPKPDAVNHEEKLRLIVESLQILLGSPQPIETMTAALFASAKEILAYEELPLDHPAITPDADFWAWQLEVGVSYIATQVFPRIWPKETKQVQALITECLCNDDSWLTSYQEDLAKQAEGLA